MLHTLGAEFFLPLSVAGGVLMTGPEVHFLVDSRSNKVIGFTISRGKI